MNYFENKRILVTGAGTVGSEIVRTLLKYNPYVIRVLDNSEIKLYNLKQELPDDRLRFLYGDIRDKERIRKAMEKIDIVFNTAALKHVAICEIDPIDAVKTNILGTQNLIEVAIEEQIDRMITISTDKAANPVNVMGATKLLSEKLVNASASYTTNDKPIFSSVRFGNVMGSSGSVVPLFRRQIKAGGPITLTNPKMTRFMMSTKEAVDLILKATTIMKGREIFILKMPALKLTDLAQAAIEEFARDFIEVKIIGHIYGEKIHEELITKEEIEHAYENEKMIVVCDYKPKGFKKSKFKKYSSDNVKLLSIEEIKKLFGG